MSSNLLVSAAESVGNVSSVLGTLRDMTNKGVHIVSGMLDGCVQVPSKAENIYVFFVIHRDGDNYYYVAGNMLSEKERIIQHLLEDYRYVIFRPAKVKDIGLPDIAAGESHYEVYRNATPSQLKRLRQDNPKLYYMATDDDVEYLKLRLDTLDVGKVIPRLEMERKLSMYSQASRHLYDNPNSALYQCVLDIAIALD